MQSDVADYLTHLEKERNVSPNTLTAYASDCAYFVDFLTEYYGGGTWSWQGVDRLAMRGFMGRLTKRGLSKRAIAPALAAGRGLDRYLALNDVGDSKRARAARTPQSRAERPPSRCPPGSFDDLGVSTARARWRAV